MPEDGSAAMQAFHGHCDNCDFASPETVGGTPALVLDGPSDDPDVDPTDPRLILLHDRRGRETIARNGFSFLSATLNGRYLRISEVFCTECGRLYQIRSLAPAFAQIGVWLWIVFAIPFAILFFAISPSTVTGILNGIFFGFITGGATVALIDPAVCVYLRVRYPSRAREFGTPAVCPDCGSKRNLNPASLALVCGADRGRNSIPCPNCKRVTMAIEEAKRTNAA